MHWYLGLKMLFLCCTALKFRLFFKCLPILHAFYAILSYLIKLMGKTKSKNETTVLYKYLSCLHCGDAKKRATN